MNDCCENTFLWTSCNKSWWKTVLSNFPLATVSETGINWSNNSIAQDSATNTCSTQSAYYLEFQWASCKHWGKPFLQPCFVWLRYRLQTGTPSTAATLSSVVPATVYFKPVHMYMYASPTVLYLIPRHCYIFPPITLGALANLGYCPFEFFIRLHQLFERGFRRILSRSNSRRLLIQVLLLLGKAQKWYVNERVHVLCIITTCYLAAFLSTNLQSCYVKLLPKLYRFLERHPRTGDRKNHAHQGVCFKLVGGCTEGL